MTHRNSYIVRQSFNTFFFASLASSVIYQLNLLVDSIILGNLVSTNALSSQNLASPLFGILGIIPGIICTGASVIASRAIGEHDKVKFQRVFSVVMASSIAILAIMSVFLILFNDTIAHLLTSDENLIIYLTEYIPFIGLIAIASLCSFNLACFIKTEGNPRIVIYGTFAELVINILLDLLLIGLLDMGIRGAAIATACSMFGVTTFLAVHVKKRKESSIRLINPFKGWYYPYLKDSSQIGIPSGIAPMVLPIFFIVTNSLVQKVAGSDGMFVVSVYSQIQMICMLLLGGASGSIMAIGGILLGEKDLTGFRLLTNFSLKIILIGTMVFTGIMMIFPSGIAMLFGADAETAVNIQTPIREMCFANIPMCLMMGISSVYVVEGHLKLSSLIQGLMPLSVILLSSVSAYFAPAFFWLAVPAAFLLLTACFLCFSFFNSKKYPGLHWLTLAPLFSDDPHVETSISYSEDSFAESLKAINTFISICELDDRQRMKVSISTEEMIYYILKTAKLSKRNGYIDVRITDSMDPKSNRRHIQVSIKDKGTPFCPIRTYDEHSIEQPEFENELGLLLFNKNCSDIKYNYINGINSTLMSFEVQDSSQNN